MGLKRIGILLHKELVVGSKSFIVLFAIVTPLATTLLVSLLFGSLFSTTPRLGIADLGDSELTRKAAALDSPVLKQYSNAEALKKAVASGAVDFGIELPANFDEKLRRGEHFEVSSYLWGESLMKNRAAASMTVLGLTRQVSGRALPVNVNTVTIGDGGSLGWEERLLPFIVLMGIVIGGFFVPAASLVEEKQNDTLSALLTTPLSAVEVYTAKGLMGVMLSIFSGVLILALNDSFGIHPVLLVGVLFLGATMSSTFGVLFGSFIKDINTLFAAVKVLGIFLYAPALIYMFPQLPQWTAKFFPTHYIIAPVIDLSQHQASWSDIAPDIYVLLAIIAALIAITALVTVRKRDYAA